MNILVFAKTALKNLVSAPATRMYPQTPREYPERTRGHVEVNMDVCVLCGLCSKKCPADAIHVDRAAGTWAIERFGCIQCNSCVESCPKMHYHVPDLFTAGTEKNDRHIPKTGRHR